MTKFKPAKITANNHRMENEFEYYFIGRENNDQYPLLIEDSECPPYSWEKGYIEDPQSMHYCLGKPIPRKPKMADYHSSPYPVISKKIFEILDKMQIKGVQFIPATITGKNNEIYEDYYYLHIVNRHSVIDRNGSICRWNPLGRIRSLDKLVLDNEKIKLIPLSERLIFCMPEYEVEPLFHKSVVDAVMSTNPEGVKFTNVKDWNQGTPFD